MLYYISDSYTRTYWYVWRDLSYLKPKETVCNCCGRKIYEDNYDSGRHCLAVEGGSRCPDLHTTAGLNCFPIFSEKAVDLFTQHSVSGFRVDEQVFLFKEESPDSYVELKDIPPYYKVTFEGKIDFDYPAMFLKKKKLCPVCGKYDLNRQRLYPVFLDSNSWNGDDFCSVITRPGHWYCTEKVVQLAKKHKLKGFEFKAVQLK